MIRPSALVKETDGPRLALRKMKEEELSSIFVVGEGRTLRGIVTVDRAVEAVNKKEKDLRNIIDEDIPLTSPDVTLLDLIPMAITAKVPIAVVNENRKLLGIIVRVSVLSGLIAKGDENNNVSYSD
jgi:glycine betaine/proline transport system ATP-binding protein